MAEYIFKNPTDQRDSPNALWAGWGVLEGVGGASAEPAPSSPLLVMARQSSWAELGGEFFCIEDLSLFPFIYVTIYLYQYGQINVDPQFYLVLLLKVSQLCPLATLSGDSCTPLTHRHQCRFWFYFILTFSDYKILQAHLAHFQPRS